MRGRITSPMKKRFMNILLTLCIGLSLFPTRAMADNSTLCCAGQEEFCHEGQAPILNILGFRRTRTLLIILNS